MKTPILILCLMLPLFSTAHAADDSSLLLQKALFEEEANHDLTAAVKAYQAVVTDADAQRKLAATAVFRLGECYRKLGQTNDAVSQYQRVLDQFGDQTNLVTLSRQNLVGLGVETQRSQGRGIMGLTVPELLQLHAAQTQSGGGAAATPAQVEAHRLLIERLELELKAAEAELIRQKQLIKEGLAPVNSDEPFEVRPLELRRQLILARDTGPAGTADGTGGTTAAAQDFSPTVRAQLKKLLEGEIAVASQLLAEQRKRIGTGTMAPGDEIRFERDVLGLKRQLVALDGLVAVEDRRKWREMLVEEIAVAEKAVQIERKKLDNGKSLPSELAKLQRDVFALKRELLTFDATPTAGVAAARVSTEQAAPPQPDKEDAEVRRIQALLKDSPDLINAKGSQSSLGGVPSSPARTMLYQAVIAGWLRVAEFLLANGADVNAPNPSSRSSNFSDAPLHAAVMGGNKAMVKLLIDKGASVDARDGNNQTPLYVAAGRGFRAIAEQLLDAGADVNAKAYDGTTPLHEAVQQGFRNVAELLVARGANLNAQGVSSENYDSTSPPQLQGTPLHYAVALNKPAMIELLLTSNADPSARNKMGHAPLHYAMSTGTNAVAMLLKAGANANDKVPTGPRVSWTPLHYAVAKGWDEGAALLLAAGADPNAALATGFGNDAQKNYTPLMISATLNRPDIVELIDLLLANKADPNMKTDAGNAPLHRAMSHINDEQRRLAVARSLVRAGADVNAPDSNGETPLLRAIMLGDKELVALLLENKANPSAKSNEGLTPLHVAIGFQKPKEIVELLLASKADPNVIDRQGRTPLDYAKTGASLRASGGGPVQLNFPQPIPGAPAGGFGAVSDNSAETPAAKRQSELINLLRTSGGLDYAPRPDQITLMRRSSGGLRAIFQKGTNDYNQFAVYEVLAAAGWGTGPSQWIFPDFARVTISRPGGKPGAMEEIPLNVAAALAANSCSNNLPLRWGDLVNVPESEHGLNAKWFGLSLEFTEAMARCLARTVSVTVKGQTQKLRLGPDYTDVAVSATGGGASYAFTKVDFWLKQVLQGSGLLLTSSDLSRVKVKRTDAASGKTQDWTFDLAKVSVPNDLWLRDGDEIEVPERDPNAVTTTPVTEPPQQPLRSIAPRALRQPLPAQPVPPAPKE